MFLRRVPRWSPQGWWSPFDELNRMKREMDTLFGDMRERVLREPSAGVFPLMNVTESQNNYYIRAELPGIKADELDISVTGNSLSLSGERKILKENQNAKYHRREREAGKFNRIISLPSRVDTTKVEAKCVDGVLTVILPKAEAAKQKQIYVKGS